MRNESTTGTTSERRWLRAQAMRVTMHAAGESADSLPVLTTTKSDMRQCGLWVGALGGLPRVFVKRAKRWMTTTDR